MWQELEANPFIMLPVVEMQHVVRFVNEDLHIIIHLFTHQCHHTTHGCLGSDF